jgi:hypothetical protein
MMAWVMYLQLAQLPQLRQVVLSAHSLQHRLLLPDLLDLLGQLL